MVRRITSVGLAARLLACQPEPSPPTGDDTTVPSTGDTGAAGTTGPDDAVESVPGLPPLLPATAGLVDTPFTVTLPGGILGASVRVTTDGRDPVRFGVPFEGDLRVERTTVLRVAWVSDDGVVLEGPETRSWLFPAQIPAQAPPAEYPAVWWSSHPEGPFPADYGMDPEVVGDPRTAGVFPGVFRDVPTVSIVLDPDDLFGPRGIHENPLESGELWERSASVEWFDPSDPEHPIQSGAGLRLHGGSGRDPAKSTKKSFRLNFREVYGAGELEHAVFDDPTAVDRFDTLVLRARYNRSWAHSDEVQRRKALFLREQFGTGLQRATGWTAVHTRPVHLFLNGLYWGLYLLQERPDEHFVAAYLGGEEAEWDVLNSGEVESGDRVAWDALMRSVDEDLTDPDAYAAVVAQLELDAFIDYMLLQLFLGNVDWPDRNWFAARSDVEGKWWFFAWDTELIMTSVSLDRLELIDFPDTPGHVFTRLRENPSFRARVSERAERLFTHGGPLTPDPLSATWVSLGEQVVPGVIAESARWGDHWRDERRDPSAALYTYPDHWVPEFEDNLENYLPDRTSVFLDHLEGAGLYSDD